MNKIFFAFAIIFFVQKSQAQTDSSSPKKTDSIRVHSDTIHVGNLIIVKDPHVSNWKKKIETPKIIINTNSKDNLVTVSSDTVQIGRLQITKTQEEIYKKDWQSMIEDGNFNNTKISIKTTPKKLKDITTNWWILDLGFANYLDKSQDFYTITAQNIWYDRGFVSHYDMTLNNKKSSNVNLWVVQQKLNIYKHKINLKYGIGFEMFNFRFNEPISFRDNYPFNNVYLRMDTVTFSKNKLFVKYLTVPFQINFHPHPEKKKSFYASIGVSAGYLIKARNKQISNERGKQKLNGNFNINDWRFATIGELGIGSIRLYGSYGINNLFDNNYTAFDFQPYALGIRFSKF